MKYYKLIKNPEQYPSYTLNKIYPENYSAAGKACAVLDHYNSFLNQKNWIKVSAGEYFVQEGKMPEYFAIERIANNPLWKKYIEWLVQTYKIIGRFDGSAKFYGYIGSTNPNTIFENSIECIINNPIELTLEQWDKIINKTMEEEFKLPKKWCVLSQWKDTYKKYLQPYLKEYGYGNPEWNGRDYYYSYVKGNFYADNYPEMRGCVEITFEQFIKYVLKQEVVENKEIIGWKLKEDCEQYKQAALNIVNNFNFHNFVEGYNFSTNSNNERILKQAGVLELWFEPVYKEKFKVGDWVTVYLESTQWTYTDKIKDWTCHSYCILERGLEPFKHLLRKATLEEIKAAQYPQITINDYKGEFFDNYVKFGCAKIDKNWFLQFYEIMRTVTYSNKEIESVTIGKGTFTKDQIKEIAEFYLNKK